MQNNQLCILKQAENLEHGLYHKNLKSLWTITSGQLKPNTAFDVRQIGYSWITLQTRIRYAL